MITVDDVRCREVWERFADRVVPSLDEDDDVGLWIRAVGQIVGDAEFLCERASRQVAFITIGRCSHWLRPHQLRWSADGGFAWPTGYGGSGYSLRGLPEFDWSHHWQWSDDEGSWLEVDGISGKRPLQLRIALPSTQHHEQAAVHTIWTPGSPTLPGEKLLQFYGFRRIDDEWTATAHLCSNNAAYEN